MVLTFDYNNAPVDAQAISLQLPTPFMAEQHIRLPGREGGADESGG